jgi:NhaP-type Na+/H+ and K+/H+ antiporter
MSATVPQAASHELLGNVLNMMQEMTPRDVNALRKLKEHHLVLLEVRITAVAAALGMAMPDIHLPPETQLLTVLRDGKATFGDQIDRLIENDVVFLLTNIRHEAYIRQALTSPSPILLSD